MNNVYSKVRDIALILHCIVLYCKTVFCLLSQKCLFLSVYDEKAPFAFNIILFIYSK